MAESKKARQAAYAKERYYDRIEDGLCGRCGGEPENEGASYCTKCKSYIIEQNRKRLALRNLKKSLRKAKETLELISPDQRDEFIKTFAKKKRGKKK